METQRIGHDITALRNQLPAPGIGFVPINAFVLHAAEPVVIDCGHLATSSLGDQSQTQATPRLIWGV